MKRSSIRLTAVVAGAALLAAACATMESKKAETRDPVQLVEERQKLMKGHADAWKGVQDSAKAGSLPGVATNADRLAKSAPRITGFFPPGSMTEKSKAKPEIWQKWPEFEAAAKNLETQSVKLRDTANSGNAQATNDLIKDFGRNACGTCHTPFRVPPPRQG